MKIDSNHVKKLREARAWSQEHLSTAAGLSLRTVQRVEKEGVASAETKMAIASAFNVAAEKLTSGQVKQTRRYPGARIGLAFGWTFTGLGAVLACAGVAYGHNSGFEAGIDYGLIGLLSGLSFAVIGIIADRYRRVETSASN